MYRQPRTAKTLPIASASANRLQPKFEASAWLLLSLATIVYGNGKSDFVTVVLHHPEIYRFCKLPAVDCESQLSKLSTLALQKSLFGRDCWSGYECGSLCLPVAWVIKFKTAQSLPTQQSINHTRCLHRDTLLCSSVSVSGMEQRAPAAIHVGTAAGLVAFAGYAMELPNKHAGH